MQKTNKLFRLLAGLLAVLMLSICIPVSAFADEGEDKMGGHKPTVTITVLRYVDGDKLDEVKIPVTWGDKLLDSLEQNKAAITENDKYAVKSYSDPFGHPLYNVKVLLNVTVKACLETVVTTKEVVLNYYDQTNDVQVKEEKATVDASATVLDQSLIKLPEGYTLDPNNTYAITEDGYVYIGMYEIPSTKEVVLNYYDQTNNVQVKEEKATVDASATVLDQSLIKLPEGYTLDPNNTYAITEDGYVYIGMYEIPSTKEVVLNYYDQTNNVQVKEEKATVDASATVLDQSLIKLPEGYTLDPNNTYAITEDGYVYIGLYAAASTKEVVLNYYDQTNNVQVKEEKATVDASATVLDQSLIKLPEGYKLDPNNTYAITEDGYVYIGLYAEPTTKVVKLNFYDEVNDRQVSEGAVTVDSTATTVDTACIALPNGYELIEEGELQINDGWVYVAVKPIENTRVIGLNYYDEVNKVQVCEREMVVDAAATSIAGSSVPALEGYELLIGDTLQINDNWVYIGVKPLETKSVGLNFFDEENYEQVEERYIDVPMDAETVNTSDIELPDGYEFITTGNIEINDNWVYVGVKCVKTLRIYWAIDNGEAADFADGSADTWTQELTWKHVNDDITMPEITVKDGYVFNGWSVSGQEGEFWKPSLKTVNVGDKYVADENGGIISITANIVTKEEAESGSSDNTTNNNNSNNNDTKTVSSNNNQVVKAETPADNTAKVMPQTGLTAETPVVFGVMMVAALAGAGAYLFAIRKKLN